MFLVDATCSCLVNHLNFHAGYDRWVAYGHSKLSNVLFARELDRRLKAAGSPVKVGRAWVAGQGRARSVRVVCRVEQCLSG